MKKIEFKNLPDKTTPINSTNLNKIQDNIEALFEGNESMGSIVVEDITCKNYINFDNIQTYNRNISSTPTVGNKLSFFGTTKALQFYIPVSHLRGMEVIYSNSVTYANNVRIFEVDSNYCFISYFSTSMTNGNWKSGIIDDTTSYLCVILVEETDISLTADIKPQLEKGSTATEYTPYKKFGYNSTDSMGEIVVDDITCKNILPNNIYSQTINGVTITRGEDGSLTFNGTTTAYTKLEIVPNLELDSGTYTFYFSEEGTVSGNFFGAIRDENSGVIGKDLQIHNSITVNSFSLAEAKQVTITVALGTSTTVTNFKIYPMLEKGSTATGYTEYKKFSYNSTDSMGKIVVEDVTCKNLFNAYSVNIVTRSNEETYTINGVNKITVSSLSSSSTWNRIKVTINGLKPNTKYTINSDVNNPSRYRAGLLCEYATNSINNIRTDANFNSKITVTTDSNGAVEIQFFINHSGTGHLTTVIFDNIQLEEGTVNSDYVEHKEFSNKQIYSTSEQVIGTWIDGKPLYRKVIDFGALPNTTSKSVAHNISNIDYIVDIRSTAALPGGDTTKLDTSDKDGLKFSIHISANNTNITVLTGSDRSGFTRCFVTLEYTKTTN